MGYRTRYELSFEEAGPRSLETEYAVAKWVRENEEISLALQEDGTTNEDVHWYGWESDLRTLSASMPHVWFILEGWGADTGDIWKAYAKGGKLEKVQAEMKFKVPGFFKLKH